MMAIMCLCRDGHHMFLRIFYNNSFVSHCDRVSFSCKDEKQVWEGVGRCGKVWEGVGRLHHNHSDDVHF